VKYVEEIYARALHEQLWQVRSALGPIKDVARKREPAFIGTSLQEMGGAN